MSDIRPPSNRALHALIALFLLSWVVLIVRVYHHENPSLPPVVVKTANALHQFTQETVE